MNIYTAFTLRPDQTAALTAAGHTLVQPADFKLEQAVSTIAVVLGWDQNAQQLLAGPNHVRWVQTVSAGVDYLPLDQLAAQHVLVSNTSGIHAEPIAESVLAYLLAFGRGMQTAQQLDPAALWHRSNVMADMFTLADDRTAVVLGTGHIGQEIARLLQAFGVHTLGISAHGRPALHFDQVGTDADTDAFLARADFVINVMPLTPSTHHFLNAARFAKMSRKPVVVNVGRGPSLDTDALLAALDAGQIRGAALDVFEQEPLPTDSPLLKDPRIIVTPHVSGTVPHLRREVYAIFSANLQQFTQNGTLARNQVNLAAGY
ncbi:NAD(P)-dependent oxidoreductase [Lacticaseibacillus hulanensis]|uniref:NAD(P)-dependent oxidoreductase n=1 Tax=Lacticaseibacillus hulanensis TaxID=2493111 RepID=UPI000FD81126|nr:NAD(P)-dependent oxidoreductase [Lacticaseibacillus hulanensis]